jgi:hypothetical protein
MGPGQKRKGEGTRDKPALGRWQGLIISARRAKERENLLPVLGARYSIVHVIYTCPRPSAGDAMAISELKISSH